MALTYNQRASEIMLHLVTHAAHGYSQPARAGDGTIETLKLSDGTVTTVHGGDYDCSEAVRMCYVAAGVLPRGCYMWTGNEAALLKSHGFAGVGLGDLRVGDVLLRNGHTEMVVSVGGRLMQAGFRISERHTISGVKGDQTGWESSYSALNPGAWSWAYRYVGGQPTGASKAAVHNATVSMSIPAGTYQCVVDALNVRAGAGTGYAKVAQYHKGETVALVARARRATSPSAPRAGWSTCARSLDRRHQSGRRARRCRPDGTCASWAPSTSATRPRCRRMSWPSTTGARRSRSTAPARSPMAACGAATREPRAARRGTSQSARRVARSTCGRPPREAMYFSGPFCTGS